MACDVVRVRLRLRGICVLAVVSDTPSELVVGVESAVSRPWCPRCGLRCGRVRGTRGCKICDLEVSGRPVMLVWRRHRFSCGDCEERFLEGCAAFGGRLTRRLARRLVTDAQVMAIPGGGAPPSPGMASGDGAGARLVRTGRRAPAQPQMPGAAGR